MSLLKVFNHFLSYGPKLKDSKESSINSQFSVSNAFSKSIKRSSPYRSLSSIVSTKSDRNLLLSAIFLTFMKPFCDALIIFGKIFFILLAIAEEAIL